MAAVLDAGSDAVVSHQTAARLWCLPGFANDDLHVSRPRGGTRRPAELATVHEPRTLPRSHVTVTNAIPVTSVARTVFDLAGAVHPRCVERALDNALARGHTTVDDVRRVTEELAAHGRAGSAEMRRLMTARESGFVAPESGLEARFLQLLRSGGLPEPACQVDVGGARWIGRVDFAYRQARLVIEVDSAVHHTATLDREADRRRDAQLVQAGFRVVRITDDQVWLRPGEAVAAVREALAAAAA